MARRPLALHVDELWSQVEQEVVSLDHVRVPDADSEVGGTSRDRQLRHDSLLVCRQH